MKQFAFLVLGLCMSVMIYSCSAASSATKNEDKTAQEAALKKAIENRKFVINVDRMVPMKGRSRSLTSLYSLELNGDTVKSYLPYVGEAHSVPYGGGKGLTFDSTITDYKASPNDSKGKTTIEFKTKTDEDNFVYNIEIFNNGSSSIQVTSINRQAISFYGTAEAKK